MRLATLIACLLVSLQCWFTDNKRAPLVRRNVPTQDIRPEENSHTWINNSDKEATSATPALPASVSSLLNSGSYSTTYWPLHSKLLPPVIPVGIMSYNQSKLWEQLNRLQHEQQEAKMKLINLVNYTSTVNMGLGLNINAPFNNSTHRSTMERLSSTNTDDTTTTSHHMMASNYMYQISSWHDPINIKGQSWPDNTITTNTTTNNDVNTTTTTTNHDEQHVSAHDSDNIDGVSLQQNETTTTPANAPDKLLSISLERQRYDNTGEPNGSSDFIEIFDKMILFHNIRMKIIQASEMRKQLNARQGQQQLTSGTNKSENSFVMGTSETLAKRPMITATSLIPLMSITPIANNQPSGQQEKQKQQTNKGLLLWSSLAQLLATTTKNIRGQANARLRRDTIGTAAGHTECPSEDMEPVANDKEDRSLKWLKQESQKLAQQCLQSEQMMNKIIHLPSSQIELERICNSTKFIVTACWQQLLPQSANGPTIQGCSKEPRQRMLVPYQSIITPTIKECIYWMWINLCVDQGFRRDYMENFACLSRLPTYQQQSMCTTEYEGILHLLSQKQIDETSNNRTEQRLHHQSRPYQHQVAAGANQTTSRKRVRRGPTTPYLTPLASTNNTRPRPPMGNWPSKPGVFMDGELYLLRELCCSFDSLLKCIQVQAARDCGQEGREFVVRFYRRLTGEDVRILCNKYYLANTSLVSASPQSPKASSDHCQDWRPQQQEMGPHKRGTNNKNNIMQPANAGLLQKNNNNNNQQLSDQQNVALMNLRGQATSRALEHSSTSLFLLSLMQVTILVHTLLSNTMPMTTSAVRSSYHYFYHKKYM